MALKTDQCQPTPDWLAELNPADLDPSSFPLAKVLRGSLYYPAAGFDGRPVQFLGGFVHSFIYVDYGQEERDVDREVQDPGFLGYHLAGKTALQERDLAPSGWSPRVPPQFDDQRRRFVQRHAEGFVREPFATWYLFDRAAATGEDHGPSRFSLVYMCADGIAAYQALYLQNNTAPAVLVIIQPGLGWGGNYTDFTDPNGFFAWTVLNGNDNKIPEYLVCGDARQRNKEAFWPDAYPEHVEWFQLKNGNGVWRRRR